MKNVFLLCVDNTKYIFLQGRQTNVGLVGIIFWAGNFQSNESINISQIAINNNFVQKYDALIIYQSAIIAEHSRFDISDVQSFNKWI